MTTVELHPEFLTKNGEKQFAVIPYHEFVELTEWLEDIEDLLDLRAAKEAEAIEPSVTLDEVEREFGIK